MNLLRKTICLACILASTAPASNKLFIKGDAYFSSALTKDFFEHEFSGDKMSLNYARYVGVFMSCGYHGYDNLDIVNVPDSHRKNLERVQEILFKEFARQAGSKIISRGEGEQKKEIEQKFFPMFVYNESFPTILPVALRFNHEWAAKDENDHGRLASDPRVVYQGMMEGSLVARDWQWARAVKPLDIATYPDVSKLTAMETEYGYEPPMTANGKGLKFVILAGTEVGDFALQKHGLTFFVVSDTIERFVMHDVHGGQKVAIDVKPDDFSAKVAAAQKDLRVLTGALEVYHFNTGEYPSDEQGLEALVEKPANDAPENWMQVLHKLPKDPWGEPYQHLRAAKVRCNDPDDLGIYLDN